MSIFEIKEMKRNKRRVDHSLIKIHNIWCYYRILIFLTSSVSPLDVAAINIIPRQSITNWFMSGRENYGPPTHTIYQT